MNYSDIKFTDMINGKGIRVSLFVSGCEHHCKDCFNSVTWNPNHGMPFDDDVENDILNYFKKYSNSLSGLSLLGGDPTYKTNIIPLVKFVNKFKKHFPEKNIWIWSGFTWEMIKENKNLYSLVSLCDVLVDGKFDINEKNIKLKWRGSNNQRVLDIKKCILENKIIQYNSLP